MTAWLAFGSNEGDRCATIHSAFRTLDQHDSISVVATSSLVETSPVGPDGQGPYLNAAARVSTTLGPAELLAACLEIEREHGRDRSRERRWGARRLDIDLLLYADATIDEPGLTVPHPRMHERSFVLVPLAEIAPRLVHPRLGLSVESLLARLGSDGIPSPPASVTS